MVNKRHALCREHKIVYNLCKIDCKAVCSLINLAQLPELRLYFSLYILSHLAEAFNDNGPTIQIEDLLIWRLVCVASIAFVQRCVFAIC
jgi:hypothetical protein